jgi:hypothetical protein
MFKPILWNILKVLLVFLLLGQAFVAGYEVRSHRRIQFIDNTFGNSWDFPWDFYYNPPASSSPSLVRARPSPRSTPQATPAPTPAGQFLLREKQMNDSFAVDGLDFVVESARNLGSNPEIRDADGSFFSGKSNGGEFIEVDFAARNNGVQSASLGNITVYFRDSKGRTYRQSSLSDLIGGSQVIASKSGYTEFVPFNPIETIKPGFSRKYFTVIEVAADSSGLIVIIANQKEQNYFVRLPL